MIEGDIRGVILSFDQVLHKGFDGHQFIVGLASHFRDLWMCKHPDTISLIEVGSHTQKISNPVRNNRPIFFEKAIAMTNECDLQYKASKNQRLHVELCLMQIASVEDKKKKDKPYIKPALKTDKAPQNAKAHNKEEPKPIAEPIVSKSTDETTVETEKPETVEKPNRNQQKYRIRQFRNPFQLIFSPKVFQDCLSPVLLIKRTSRQISPQMAKAHARKALGKRDWKTAWKALSSKLEDDGEYNLAALLNLDSPRLKNKVRFISISPIKPTNSNWKVKRKRLLVHLLMS